VGNVPGGNSGDCYPDQHELSWEDIGVEPELTTVTKRPRRVFTWSRHQVSDAFEANLPDVVFINFCNYLSEPRFVARYIDDVRNIAARHGKPDVRIFLGYGPRASDIYEA
jgi:adenylosuccinate synthase